MLRKIKKIIKSNSEVLFQNQLILKEMINTKLLLGKQLSNEVRKAGILTNIHNAEFKVFSQFGDDGIIQYLINNIDIDHKRFIEFGVQDYSESNTRFLLINSNWKGLIIDGNKEYMDKIKWKDYYWRHDLKAVGEFITKKNINNIFKKNNFTGEIGLLSIDIDGNDFWIWDCIDVINPVIVIVEYNSVFGYEHAITIPYDEAFVRTNAHYSNLYWGASLKALNFLAEKKGYIFVGSNSGGNNAYFVREDKVGAIYTPSIEEGYVESKFRDSRDEDGKLNFISGKERLRTIKDCIVYDVINKKQINIQEIFKLD